MPAATFSIVACDLARREWGAAVASKFLAVGALCTWTEPEVGAVATQSFVNAAHGRDGLRLLATGAGAAETRDRLLAADPQRELRQLGIVDAQGNAATFTGAGCMPAATGRVGDGYAAQGNLLVSEDTVEALAAAFTADTSAPLAARLLAALDAAQATGGDRRGKQSAALQVVRPGGGYGGAGIVVDLRVDDHPEPLVELRRLYDLHDYYFGSTPPEQWLTVDRGLHAELRQHLDRLGYRDGDLEADLLAWAGMENLEDRLGGADRIDPVVLDALRQAGSGSR